MNDGYFANALPGIFGPSRRPVHRRYRRAAVNSRTGARYGWYDSYHWQRYAWACARRYWPMMPPREQSLLAMRRAGATLTDVGRVLGVSRERVRQLEERALRRATDERRREKTERANTTRLSAYRLAYLAYCAGVLQSVGAAPPSTPSTRGSNEP